MAPHQEGRALGPKRDGADRWDQHANLKFGHSVNAKATDKPIAALLRDLKARGMLDEALILWTDMQRLGIPGMTAGVERQLKAL